MSSRKDSQGPTNPIELPDPEKLLSRKSAAQYMHTTYGWMRVWEKELIAHHGLKPIPCGAKPRYLASNLREVYQSIKKNGLKRSL